MNLKINYEIFNHFPLLESDRLTFRAFENNDANDLFLVRSDKDVMEFMDAAIHSSVIDAEKLIQNYQNSFINKEGISWAIIEKASKEVIGYFSFWRLISDHCRAEIGYALKSSHWKKGYMHETLMRMIDFAFKEFHLHSIEANTNPLNEASKQLLLKAGFRQEAYFRENYLFDGRFTDSVIFSLVESDINGK